MQSKFEANHQFNTKFDTRLGLEIKILDINDHAPTFNNSDDKVTVDESHDQGNQYTSQLTVITHPRVIAVHSVVIFFFIG